MSFGMSQSSPINPANLPNLYQPLADSPRLAYASICCATNSKKLSHENSSKFTMNVRNWATHFDYSGKGVSNSLGSDHVQEDSTMAAINIQQDENIELSASDNRAHGLRLELALNNMNQGLVMFDFECADRDL